MRALLAVLVFTPFAMTPLGAQAASKPETRYVTVTYLQMPFPKVAEFMKYMDKYTLARDKANPHILSFKYLTHSWGNAEQTLWFIAEYKDMGEIERANEWDEEQYRKQVPDSAQRAAIDKEFEEKYSQYFAHHVDNILVGQVKRMKP